MQKQLITKVAFLAAALAGTFAFSGCGKEEAVATAPQGPTEVPLPVEDVVYQDREIIYSLPGRVDAVRLADVSARVTGILLERKFEEGAKVEKDQVLFQIDPDPLIATRDAAAADLASAEASLDGAQITFKRYSELVDSGGVSRQAYDDARVAVDSAKAQVLAAKAALRTAEINLGYASVTAPITGIIGAALVTEGALVSGNALTPMAVIQQMDPINFDFTRSSKSLLELRAAINAGTVEKIDDETVAVKLVLEDGSTYPYTGKLKFSEVTVDKSTGMYKLRAEFPNPDNTLLPGMFARAVISAGVNHHAILVPQKAVSIGTAGKATIYVVDENDLVTTRSIQIGEMDGTDWVVKDGLKAGDRYAANGLIAIAQALAQNPLGVKAVDSTPGASAVPEPEPAAEAPAAEVAPAEGAVPAEPAPAEAAQ